MNKIIQRPEIIVKIKGDAGRYTVWGIDWLNHKILVERACGYEYVSFDNITILESELTQSEQKTCSVCGSSLEISRTWK